MPIFPKLSRAAALATLLVAGAPAPVATAQDEPYAEPNFAKSLFAREAILLETAEVDSVVSALAALAANFPGTGAADNRLRAKALAIALRLDGTQPAAVSVNRLLRSGEVPDRVPDFNTIGDVAEALWETASYLESPEKGKDERVLQYCLVDIAREIDPGNLAESNQYPTRLPASVFPGWAGIVEGADSGFVFEGGGPPAEPDPPVQPSVPDKVPDAPSNPTRTAQGSYRSVIAGGSSGSVANIRGDLKAGGGTAPLAVVFSDEEGSTALDLNKSRDMMVSALTELQGSWPQDGGVLVLSVPSAGGSDPALLLPGALLADSLMRNWALHPRTVALGAVAPEGSLIPVERLPQRLQALTADDIEMILVPEENLPQLQDMALLGDLETLFRYQFIFVGSLKQAAVAAASEHDEDFAKSLANFNIVQEVAEDNPASEMTNSGTVKTYLANILGLNPQHASAKLLLDHGNGKLPKNLTREGSLAALNRATGPVVSAFRRGTVQRPTAMTASKSVSKTQSLLHPDIAELGGMMGALLKDIGDHAGMADKNSTAAEALKIKISSDWEKVRSEYSRLKNGG